MQHVRRRRTTRMILKYYIICYTFGLTLGCVFPVAVTYLIIAIFIWRCSTSNVLLRRHRRRRRHRAFHHPSCRLHHVRRRLYRSCCNVRYRVVEMSADAVHPNAFVGAPPTAFHSNALVGEPPFDDSRVDSAELNDEELPSEHLTFERKMGDTELSYYLPSRADGVNDMCVPRFSTVSHSPNLISRLKVLASYFHRPCISLYGRTHHRDLGSPPSPASPTRCYRSCERLGLR